MLLTKTVKAKWNSKIKKWYESKGYIYTKMNDEFEAKVEDLTKGSHILVSVKCNGENCNKIYNIEWRDYLRLHKNGKIYCNVCSKHKDKAFLSFNNWCLEHDRQDIIDLWDYELNNKKINEISYSSHGSYNEGYYFKCPQGLHKSELKSIHDFTNGSEGVIYCKQCNSFAQYLIDSYGEGALNLYWDYDKNNILSINPWDIPKSWNHKVWIKCQEKNYHISYEVSCDAFLHNTRCPYCCNHYGKVHTLDSLGKVLEDKRLLWVWSDKNKKSLYEYAPNSDKKVWWKCLNKEHKDYCRSINSSNKYNFRCPECIRERDESFLQEKVRLYLEFLNYTILHERNCTIVPKNPKSKTNNTMPFDNEIKELKLICEVMGQQHYKINGFHILQAKYKNTTKEEEFHYQKLKDRYKKFIAYKNGYNYMAIPYWTDDKDETWKQLINNKIINIQIL